MSRIFLSHSSKDNDSAVALREWLAGQGWDDVFLDLDPQRGIAGGDRWERSLNQAALRCEVVLFLVSRAWLSSEWCLKELNLAYRLNKRLFGLLIEDIPVGDLPASLTGTWQVVPLASGRDHVMLRVVLPGSHEEVHVTFSQEGLNRLRIGLERAGLDARFFAWPPADDPERPPYRGLLPLDAADAGIFFGREAPTVEALDRIRGMRDAAPPRLLVVLGASGSGKSSFLRAGLLPRLGRDDRNYVCLPVVRPERAVITGETGLMRSLESALAARGLAKTRSEIREAIDGGADTLRPLLRPLAEKNLTALTADDPDAKAATLVLPIDQGEELFLADGASESATLFALLRQLMTEDDPALVVLITIRSDSYDHLQTAKALEGVGQQTMSLAPMPRGAYQAIIEGPAARLKEIGRPLVIEPALTQALLADIENGGGRDALPLLAFTLERLYLEYGARGRLTLNDYDVLGRIKGSIEAAIERAFRAADHDARIPRDREARLALLRRGLIPWLAGIDPDTGSPRRQKARISEIPEESRPLIDLLVGQRLLSTDATADTGEATIEPTHEALLRQWGLLQGWLQSDFTALMSLESVKRAARDWEANARSGDWLGHGAGRLEDAEQLLLRRDFARRFDETDRNYLTACRAKVDAELQDKASALERELALQTQARKRARAFSIAAIIVAVLMSVLGALAYSALYVAELQRKAALESQSMFLAKESRQATNSADSGLGVLLSLAALPSNLEVPDRPLVPAAENSLAYGYARLHEQVDYIGHNRGEFFWYDAPSGFLTWGSPGEVVSAAFSPDQKQVLTASTDYTARVWNRETGATIAILKGHTGQLTDARYSADGAHILTSAMDRTLRLWNAETGAVEKTVQVPDSSSVRAYGRLTPDNKHLLVITDKAPVLVDLDSDARTTLSSSEAGNTSFGLASLLSPDGKRVLSTSEEKLAVLWDVESRSPIVKVDVDRYVQAAAFSDDSRSVAVSSADGGETSIYETKAGGLVAALEGSKGVVDLAFSSDGALIAGALGDTNSIRVWNATTGALVRKFEGHTDAINSLDFSHDGRLLVSSSNDGTARIWDLTTAEPSRFVFAVLRGHQARVVSAIFSADDRQVLTASSDDTARLWNVRTRPLLATIPISNTTTSLSRAGRLLAYLSADHLVRIMDLTTAKLLPTADMKQTHEHTFEFSPDASLLLTAGYDDLHVWNATSGSEKFVKQLKGSLYAASFSPDGSHLLALGDLQGKVWNTQTGQEELSIDWRKPIDTSDGKMRFAPDNKTVVVVDGGIKMVDLATKDTKYVFSENSGEGARSDFSPDGAYLVACADACVMWDWESKKPVLTLGPGEEVLFGRHDYLVVTSQKDRFELVRSNHQKLPPIKLLASQMLHANIQVSPDLTRALLNNNEQNLSLYDVETGELVSQFYGDSRSGFIGSAKYSLDGSFIMVTMSSRNGEKSGGQVWLLDGHSGAVILAADAPEVEPDRARGYSIVASGGSQFLTVTDKAAQLWRYPARCAELLQLASARRGARKLTQFERQENFVLPEQGEGPSKFYATAKGWLGWALPNTPGRCF